MPHKLFCHVPATTKVRAKEKAAENATATNISKACSQKSHGRRYGAKKHKRSLQTPGGLNSCQTAKLRRSKNIESRCFSFSAVSNRIKYIYNSELKTLHHLVPGIQRPSRSHSVFVDLLFLQRSQPVSYFDILLQEFDGDFAAVSEFVCNQWKISVVLPH